MVRAKQNLPNVPPRHRKCGSLLSKKMMIITCEKMMVNIRGVCILRFVIVVGYV